ncbi:MAG: hypothetical protein BIFFINMI_00349 [Phycisphaerae bacterium]|nr:hypothetical protein [Phycisphaerae bacterium]
MTSLGLILRNLWHFRRQNLAIAAGMAVATAALAGALMVGDSVRVSLRDLAIRRLGPVDHAMSTAAPFDADLGERLAADPAFAAHFKRCIAGLSVRGGASNRKSGAQAAQTAGVSILALDGWMDVAPGRCVINRTLAEDLNVAVGDPIDLTVPMLSDLPLDSLMARRQRQNRAAVLRVTVGTIADGDGWEATFSLQSSQRAERLAWVNAGDLRAKVVRRPRGRATSQPAVARVCNLLLVQARADSAGKEGAVTLNEALGRAMNLGDLGLEIAPVEPGTAALTSRRTYLGPGIEQAARDAAEAAGVQPQLVSVYLANAVNRAAADGRPAASIHYAVVAGLSEPPGGAVGPDEIVLNEWAAGADRLNARVGDTVRLSYYRRGPGGELVEQSSADAPSTSAGQGFRVARIVPMAGLGADRKLTPSFEGMTDAATIGQWDPPAGMHIDRKLADEAYWDRYGPAPQVFVNVRTAERLWGDVFGDLTSVRVPAASAEAFAAELRRRVTPMMGGMFFRPVKAQNVAAADGPTDFGQIFIGMSFYLIAAAGLLVALLFGLGIEQRSRQIGLLGALGFGRGRVRRLALAEAAALAVVGASVGLAGAAGYSWLVMAGLRTWWVAAVGTTQLHLAVTPATVATGWAAGVAVALLAVSGAVWRLGRAEAAALLAGAWGVPTMARRRGGRVGRVAGVLMAAGTVGLFVAPMAGGLSPQAGFLSGGGLLLAAALVLLATRWRAGRGSRKVGAAVVSLGLANASRNPGRSVLAVGLLALAAFSLVTVAAFREGEVSDTSRKTSGAGGFTAILQADIPLAGDLNTADGRLALGLDANDPIWSDATYVGMRLAPGQDISCLNLTRPTHPAILGVPEAMILRGGFAFARNIDTQQENRWLLLTDASADDAIPVIADDDTATYLLKLAPGDTMSVADAGGHAHTLRLVATLKGSIFQGQLLMADARFRSLFPADAGDGVVLIEPKAGVTPAGMAELRRRLSASLADFAVRVEPTADRLARYQEVANTYLATFQLLGALGLLLGTAGLAVVLVRSLIERRSELALLAAMGFAPGRRLLLVVAENAWLLLLGVLLGTVTAGLGVAPTVATGAHPLNFAALAASLGGVLLVGLLALVVAARLAARHYTPADLRRE